jgi:dTDP-4-dehydrorhamnose 3,5-epimerase
MNNYEKSKEIEGVWLGRMKFFKDKRGDFSEIYKVTEFPEVSVDFVQDNYSRSNLNVLRGLHMQVGQWQIVNLVQGSVTDFLFDARLNSKTFKNLLKIDLNENGINQIILPPGVAHGYYVTSKQAVIFYKSSVTYGSSREFGINFKSLELTSHIKTDNYIISSRDRDFPHFSELIKDFEFSNSFLI